MIELAELVSRLDDPDLTILDVRSRPEFTGERGYASDPRQGRIPGARHVWVAELIMRRPEEIRELVGLPEGPRSSRTAIPAPARPMQSRPCRPRAIEPETTSARGTSGRAIPSSPPRPGPPNSPCNNVLLGMAMWE